MAASQKGNLPRSPLRWNVTRASTEFSTSRETLQAGFARVSIKPAEDGHYSTKEICRALYSDLHHEQLRRTREDADNIALKNAALRAEFAPVAEINSAIATILLAIERELLASELSEGARESMIKHLRHGFNHSPEGPRAPKSRA